MLGEKLKKAIKNAGISYARAASEMGISEGSLYNIFKKDSFEVSYLLKASELVGLPPSYFLEADDKISVSNQSGEFNQAGSGNQQKIRVSSKAPSQELAAELLSCRQQLELTKALVASQSETITLLRASYNRPN